MQADNVDQDPFDEPPPGAHVNTANDASAADGSSPLWIGAARLLLVNWRAWLADWGVVVALGIVILAVVFLTSLLEL